MAYKFNPTTGKLDVTADLPSSLTADANDNLTFTARWIQSTNGAASAPAHALTGTWFTGGTSTTTKPQLLIEPAGTTSANWSTAGTGLGVNAASGFTGNLLDLQVNGVKQLQVSSGGIISGGSNAGIDFNGMNTGRLFLSGNSSGYGILLHDNLVYLHRDAVIAWDGSGTPGSLNIDLFINRDAANTLAQRNGTNPQAFRLYNTYTSATNHELAKLSWSSNVFQLGTEKGSAGGTARAMELQTDGTTRLALAADGSTITAASGTNLVANHRLTGTSPVSATATGTAGDIRQDADYIYICTATNTWKRAAIATW